MPSSPADQPHRLGSLLSQACSESDPASRERAFAELMRLLTIFVRAGMGSALRHHRESIDICQSVVKSFVGDLQNGKLSFPNENALVAYLQQVVRSKLAEAARIDGAWKRGGRAVVVPLASFDALHSPQAPDAPASFTAAAKEVEDRLAQSLSPEEQELLRLRRNGLDWTAIAQAVGKNSAAVRKTWSRMRERLGNDFPIDDC